MNLNNFYFNGFLPASKTQRIEKLKELCSLNVPIVFFESVHRIKQSLKDIDQVFNKPYFVVCRELTKLNETIYRGKYDEIINDIIDKGEFVVIVQKQLGTKANDSLAVIQQAIDRLEQTEKSLDKACEWITNNDGWINIFGNNDFRRRFPNGVETKEQWKEYLLSEVSNECK